ncbi:Rne/Rng family ribonuclease [Arthrobacter gengyunqii]|uniref:Ribonuclease E n=1 Tax=Arthrobacter gengyunqii TaxID=2886940 RepID=A0A9X1S6P8_9MICC|nr:Rne/Rng family ribonuclease [Arthrobacter gengyunqii]MCC3270043.1 Rne/Rng family ribonuclease [Arthrobacter gengyunqii]UOY95039.1 Rne/Rng family ribonuclease [Arthrobacter gengyunqii]
MSDALNNDLAANENSTESAPAKRATRSRRKSVAASAPAAVEDAAKESPASVDAAPAEAAVEKPKRVRASRRKTVPAGEAAPAVAEAPAGQDADKAVAAEAAAGTAAAPADSAPAAEAPVKAVRRRRAPAKKPAAEAAAETPAAPESAAAAEAPSAETPAGGTSGTADAVVEAAPEAKAAPRTRARRRPAKVAEKAQEAPLESADDSPADVPAADAAADDTVASAAAAQTPSPAGTAAAEAAPAEDAPSSLNPFAIPALPLFHAPDLSVVRPVPAHDAGESAEAEEDSEENRGRRRSRRGRSRTRSESSNAAVAEGESEAGASTEEAPAGPDAAEGVTSRRRRRRRRGDADLELTGGADDDPPNTVTRVRAPRAHVEAPVSDRVTSVKGSTRLEAKKQRRRESRESGRRRHVITEAEFLARRESVDRQMIVRQRDERIQIGVLEDGVLAEHFVSNTQQDSLIGNVYVGKVQNVLPSMEAAFVDIGRGRNAVLYAGEVNWDAAGLDGQPRRIELALKSGDSVLVQVTKDPVGHKGARLTSQISLPGRYLVYVPGGSMTGISRKLPDVERNRLKKILKDHLPQDAGVIVRTAAEGASEEELMNDINRLRAQWENIEAKAKSTKTLAPELLYGEPDLTIKVVRDVFNEDFSKLIVSGEEAWDTIEAYVTYVAPDLVGRLEKWTKDEDIFAASRIDEQIAKALDRKVFLPSGGSLVIDRTEAMTVVDVNTGKFTGSGGNLEETVTKNNLEAAEEVVRQLRLRDIGGIIVIDFIDMVLEANRDLVLRRLVECLGRDRTKHQVAEVTSLGLVQMTRKRMGTGLLEVFGEECEHCAGRGVITHDIPVEHRRSTSYNGNPANSVTAHAISEDNHQQHLKQEKQSRGDRKRNRSRGSGAPQQQNAAAVSEEPAKTEEPGQSEAERQAKAKAEAARAALATIAAATAAAHDTVEAGEKAAAGNRSEQNRPEPAAKAPAAGAGVPGTEAGAVLNIQGETVVVPRRDRRQPASEESRFTLESLTEAFNEVAAAAAPARNQDADSKPVEKAPDADGTSAAKVEQPVARAPRRSRRSSAAAQSAQPAQAAAPVTSGAPARVAEPASAPAAASAPATAPAAAPAAVQAPARPVRRRRAAGSPQGAAGADAIQTGGADTAAPAAPVAVRHAVAPSVAQKQEKRRESAGSAPVILGVGVPASEL